MNPFRTLTPILAVIAALGIIGLLLLGYWTITEPGRQRAKTNAAVASQTVAEGRAAAGADAVAVVAASGARDAEITRQTTENTDAIRNAPGADLRLDPGLDAATRRAICMRDSARADPRCQPVQHLGPR